MKRALLVLALCGCGAGGIDDGQPGTGDAPLAAKPARVIVHYPTGWGHQIYLRGDGGGLSWWQGLQLTWSANDEWIWDVSLTKSMQLKPLFDDGSWAVGPNWTLAPGQTIDVWPFFFHQAGTIVHYDDRPVDVYLPPSYDEESGERYPVVYMHDGQNLFYDDQSFTGISWNVEGAMDQGVQDGSIHEAIVVAIGNTANRTYEYTPTDGGYGGGGADEYLSYVADELKPEIDRDFRTLTDPAHTVIAGSSLGGVVSLVAGIRRTDVFGAVGALSPSTWWDNTWILAQVTSAKQIAPRFYVDSGDAGDSNDDVTNTTKLSDELTSRHLSVKHIVQHGGQHGEYWWRQRTPGALAFLLGPR